MLLVGGAHPYTKLVYLFATNRPQVSVDSGGELLQYRYPTILLIFCVSLTAVLQRGDGCTVKALVVKPVPVHKWPFRPISVSLRKIKMYTYD